MTMFNTGNLHTLPFSDTAPQFALAASTVLTYTVPGTSAHAYRCEFKLPSGSAVYVGYNSTPTLPTAGTISTGTRCELLTGGEARFVRGGDILSFISATIVTNGGLNLLTLPGHQ